MLLFGLFVYWKQWPVHFESDIIPWLGITLSLAGSVLTLVSIIYLREHLSPFPSPRKCASLIMAGPFAVVRHPIYTGILLMMLGFFLYRSFVSRAIINVVTLGFFWLKSNYEEHRLQKVFPAYHKYKKSTGRLWPRIF